MYINTTGLVLRETRYKDSSKILTVLTESEGKLTVSVRGALRKNSPLASTTQMLTYSEMTLLCRYGRWMLTEARSIEQFKGLENDIKPLALGSYFAEVTEAVTDEDSPSRELLPLCLNALYALSEGKREPEIIKSAFEMRVMAQSGYAPLLDECGGCGLEVTGTAFLDLYGGTVRCEKCAPEDGDFVKLTPGALSAARYIMSCESKRLFSFTLGEDAQKNLAKVTQSYLLTQLDRRFRTLDYYNNLS